MLACMQRLATRVLVIGAGPAGLATAASLLERGIRPEVIERGNLVGQSWHGQYGRLHLHTVKDYSSLPRWPFPAHYPRYVPRQQVIAYLSDYAAQFGIAPRFGEEATAIERVDGAWRTRCTELEFDSEAVVLATGANLRPHQPSYPGQEQYLGALAHSRGYREPSAYRGRRVLVVGMGNTGAEIALDLAQADVDVTLSVRSPVNVVLRDVLGRPTQVTAMLLARLPRRIAFAVARKFRDWTVGDLRPWGLRAPQASPLQQLMEDGRTPVIDIGTVRAIRQGRIAVRPGIEVFRAEGVRFTDGRSEPFDAVIFATGYRPDVQGFFPQVQVPLDAHELPRDVVGSGPLAGVYFVGYDLRQPGGLLRTIGLQARQVAAAIAGAPPVRTAPATNPFISG
jgi:NADPH-dependent 2,4-dienoyl-CoA reductase/sulfur reductase-like enzyme